MIVALAAVVIGVGWFRRGATVAPSPSPVAEVSPREVERARLTRRDGKLYLGGDSRPFQGTMVEHHPDGQRLSRTEIVDGLVHGASEGWYTNGVLQIREEYRHGVSHGVRRKWYADGQLASETPIVEGTVSGLFRRWHPNGALAEEIPMVDGKPHGEARAFHADGSPKAIARMDHGSVIEKRAWTNQPSTRSAVSTASVARGSAFR